MHCVQKGSYRPEIVEVGKMSTGRRGKMERQCSVAGPQGVAQWPGLGLSLVPLAALFLAVVGNGPWLGGPDGHHGHPPSLRRQQLSTALRQVLLTADAGAAVMLATKWTGV